MAIFLLLACVTERLAEDSCSQALFRDVDGDGVGGASIGSGCPVEGAVAVGGDCDDEVPEIGDRMAAFADEDGDGFGGAAVVASCPLAAGLVERGGDCDDGDGAVFPGAPETCGDGLDSDCDGGATPCLGPGTTVLGPYTTAGSIYAGWSSTVLYEASGLRIGDADGDGVDDVITGGPGAGNAEDEDVVYVFRGPISGRLSPSDAWRTYADPDQEVSFGEVVAGPASFAGDARPMLAISAGGAFEVRVVDASSGAVATTIQGEHLGSRLADGDVDGDGVVDLLTSWAPGDEYVLRLYGGPLQAGTLGEADARLAVGVPGWPEALLAADLDGDGIAEVIAGGDWDGQVASIVDGTRDGSVAAGDVDATVGWRDAPDSAHGCALAVADLDADGVDELVVAESALPAVYVVRVDAGLVFLEDALATLSSEAADLFGHAVAAGVDANLDGAADLVVGAPEDEVDGYATGAALVYLGPVVGNIGVDDAWARLVGGQAGGGAGSALQTGGDLDGDGIGDLLLDEGGETLWVMRGGGL